MWIDYVNRRRCFVLVKYAECDLIYMEWVNKIQIKSNVSVESICSDFSNKYLVEYSHYYSIFILNPSNTYLGLRCEAILYIFA